MGRLPRGTVTFLLTDVEGSTRLLTELGGEAYAKALAEHRRVLRGAFAAHAGVEVDTQGDAFFVAFERASDAAACAATAQQSLAGGPVRVRMGIHMGEPIVTDEGYVGIDVHRAARIAAAGHGGQVLVSEQAAVLIDSLELTDLGEHRLKDLTRAERIFQLGSDPFPPLRTLGVTNLPVATWPLIGRERELAEVMAHLRDGARLLTVTGPGGTGKTRFALQVAAELLDEFPDGVFFVALAPLADPALVISTIGTTIGAGEDVAGFLRRRRTLLVLDNAEHLLACAPDIAALVAAAPGLTALVTSRAPLHVRAEEAYALEPLAPDAAALFFVERARAAGGTAEADAAVDELCRRLDRLPLAIELAAARARTLEPSLLLARLERALPILTHGPRDAPQRQRTLRATLDWSYELLDTPARTLLARLAVFAGTFSLEAAEVICDADLDDLSAIVDLSLLKATGEGRFLLLETIREFAAERLEDAADGEEIRRRHAAYFLAEVTERDRSSGSPESLAWFAREEANVLAAADWLIAQGERELALRLVAAARFGWLMRGHVAVARAYAERALELPGSAPPRVEAEALIALAAAHLDEPAATALLERARGLLADEGDERALIRWHLLYGHSLLRQGDFARARAVAEEGRSLAASAGAEDAVGVMDNLVGIVAFHAGDLDAARQLYEQGLSRVRAAGNHAAVSGILLNVGTVALEQGRLDAAEDTFEEGLAVARRIGHQFHIARALECLAGAALVRADELRARRFAADALRVRLEEGLVIVDRSGAADALRVAAAALGASASRAVARLAGAADALDPAPQLPPTVARLLDEISERCREELGDAAYAAEIEAGGSLTVEEAARFALASLD
jgi:predicted ATPase/class 3 adenylate cyclase